MHLCAVFYGPQQLNFPCQHKVPINIFGILWVAAMLLYIWFPSDIWLLDQNLLLRRHDFVRGKVNGQINLIMKPNEASLPSRRPPGA